MKAKAYYTVTGAQLVIASLLVGITAGAVSILNREYQKHNLLPVVVQNDAGECIKVINFENGHAFNCNDRDLVLRNYRTELAGES